MNCPKIVGWTYNLGMDKQMLERHLAQADEHVAIGRKNIAQQRQIIAELERGGHDTKQAIATLDNFEELQAMHLADWDRIRRELAKD